MDGLVRPAGSIANRKTGKGRARMIKTMGGVSSYWSPVAKEKL